MENTNRMNSFQFTSKLYVHSYSSSYWICCIAILPYPQWNDPEYYLTDENGNCHPQTRQLKKSGIETILLNNGYALSGNKLPCDEHNHKGCCQLNNFTVKNCLFCWCRGKYEKGDDIIVPSFTGRDPPLIILGPDGNNCPCAPDESCVCCKVCCLKCRYRFNCVKHEYVRNRV